MKKFNAVETGKLSNPITSSLWKLTQAMQAGTATLDMINPITDAIEQLRINLQSSENDPKNPRTPSEYIEGISLGIQAGDYLEMSYSPAGLGNKFTLAQMKKCVAAGIKSFRLPANCAAKADVNGVIEESYLVQIDEQINWMIEAGAERIILDPLHHYLQWKGSYKYLNTYKDYQRVSLLTAQQHGERATAMWNQISKRYANLPLFVSFDLFNEPSGGTTDTPGKPIGLTADQLNDWHEEVIKNIRATGGNNDLRCIILEPWGTRLSTLTIPRSAGNIIISPHIYSPFSFTHGPSEKISGGGLGAYVEELEYCLEWAKINDVKIIIGESGSSEYVSLNLAGKKRTQSDRAEYLAFIYETSKKYSTPIFIWDFATAFKNYDNKSEAWLPGVLDALQGKIKIREIVRSVPLINGRQAKRYWADTEIKGITFDVDGTINIPDNPTNTAREISLVYPDIKIKQGDSWIVRVAEGSGDYMMGVAPYWFDSLSPNRYAVLGIDQRGVDSVGKAVYAPGKTGPLQTFDSAFADLAEKPSGNFLSIEVSQAPASGPIRLVKPTALKTMSLS